MKKILLVFPIYNEELQVASSVQKLIEYAGLNLSNYDWKCAVVDNASKDRSPEICRGLEVTYPGKFKYIRLEEKGRGLALKHVWLSEDYDFSLYMDLDLSTDLSHVLDSIKAFENGADLTYGSRKSEGSNVTGRNTKRILTSWGYVNIVRLLSFSKIKDFQCGFKGISKSLASKLMPEMTDRRWFFDTELLLNAEKLGYKVQEIPVVWVDDPDSTVKVISDSSDMFGSLVKYLWDPSYLKVDPKLSPFLFRRVSEILTFIAIGGSAFLVEFFVSNIFNYLFFDKVLIKIGVFVLLGNIIANGIGYSVSAIYNFVLNKYITFGTDTRQWKAEIIKFFTVVLFMILILQPILMSVLQLGLHLSFNISLVLKAIIVLAANYLFHKYWTFTH